MSHLKRFFNLSKLGGRNQALIGGESNPWSRQTKIKFTQSHYRFKVIVHFICLSGSGSVAMCFITTTLSSSPFNPKGIYPLNYIDQLMMFQITHLVLYKGSAFLLSLFTPINFSFFDIYPAFTIPILAV